MRSLATGLNHVPRQRISDPGSAATPLVKHGVVRERMVRARRCFLRLAVYADWHITSVWVHGHCVDVSIYDRTWPGENQ